MTPSDAELLEEFVRRKSDAAFRLIVQRYSNLVFAAAKRQVRDANLAQDVAQAAFLVLARKASSVRSGCLPAWLLMTTRYCARDAIKKQTRRSHYEREAAMAKSEVSQVGETPDPRLALWLDEAMTHLRSRDCTAVALRYLQDRPIDDVAAAIGVSPNAAQKIVARSLLKMRKILMNKGVVLSSTAVLATALLHESAQAAPAGLVISASSSTAASFSIAKGVSQMMLWTKIKIAAAIIATTTLFAGTGSVLLIRALADAPAPDSNLPPPPPPAAAASAAPFDTPFLELVGCRIKQSVSLKLPADTNHPTSVTWVEQQYPQVQWSIDPALADKVGGYTITVTPLNDPAGAQTLRADKSAQVQSLVEQLKRPGEYNLTVSAVTADSQAIASAALHVVVNPLPYTQISISDIQPDGTIRFTYVNQELNLNGHPLTEDRFMNSDFVHVEKMTDDQGKPLRFTASHQGDTFRYRCKLNEPVQPGDAELFSNSGTETGLVRTLGSRAFLYTMTHWPGSNFPTRRIDLFRLPADATLIYASPNLVSRVVDGRTQMFLDLVIPPGGSNTMTFRYRLAPPH
ncbi:MAG: sigma-70 family RNA polymerase sigma factor [Tepidisphaeraceae bacterium]